MKIERMREEKEMGKNSISIPCNHIQMGCNSSATSSSYQGKKKKRIEWKNDKERELLERKK